MTVLLRASPDGWVNRGTMGGVSIPKGEPPMPTSPSVARELFNRLAVADNDQAIANLRALQQSDPPTFEDDVFDCKQQPLQPDPNRRRQNLKEIWSEVLTGF